MSYLNREELQDTYGGDTLSYYIDHDPRKAWYIVAKWYFDELYDCLQRKDINMVLIMSYEGAIRCLADQFYVGQRRLYSLNRYKTKQMFYDYDTETSEDERQRWKDEVWGEILYSMIDISYPIKKHLENSYNASFAYEYSSLIGTVDSRTIYGLVYKTTKDPDDSTIHSQDYITDGEYDTEDT